MVCADLMRKGYVVFPVPDQLHYDLLMDLDGRFVRIQCKTTDRPATHRSIRHKNLYQWALRTNATTYTKADIDLVALVALDTNTIAYLPYSGRQVIQLSMAGGGHKHKAMGDYSIEDALREVLK